MSKILSIDNMLEAAMESELPTYQNHVEAIEKAVTSLAEALADHLGVDLKGNAEWQGEEFGGLCASFGPVDKEQPCPDEIEKGDPEGDWR